MNDCVVQISVSTGINKNPLEVFKIAFPDDRSSLLTILFCKFDVIWCFDAITIIRNKIFFKQSKNSKDYPFQLFFVFFWIWIYPFSRHQRTAVLAKKANRSILWTSFFQYLFFRSSYLFLWNNIASSKLRDFNIFHQCDCRHLQTSCSN